MTGNTRAGLKGSGHVPHFHLLIGITLLVVVFPAGMFACLSSSSSHCSTGGGTTPSYDDAKPSSCSFEKSLCPL